MSVERSLFFKEIIWFTVQNLKWILKVLDFS